MDLAELAPEPEPEPIVELAELAPEPEPEPEPIMELAELAPDDPDLGVGEIDAAPMVTRTMAELFAAQGLVDRALEVFRQLLQAAPGDPGLRQRIAELSAKLDGGAAVPGEPEPVAADELAPAPSGQDDDDLSGHAWDAGAQTDTHEVDTPFAWTAQEPDEASPAGPAISTYFSRMLGWEPGGSSSTEEATGTVPEVGGTHQGTDGLNREES